MPSVQERSQPHMCRAEPVTAGIGSSGLQAPQAVPHRETPTRHRGTWRECLSQRMISFYKANVPRGLGSELSLGFLTTSCSLCSLCGFQGQNKTRSGWPGDPLGNLRTLILTLGSISVFEFPVGFLLRCLNPCRDWGAQGTGERQRRSG